MEEHFNAQWAEKPSQERVGICLLHPIAHFCYFNKSEPKKPNSCPLWQNQHWSLGKASWAVLPESRSHTQPAATHDPACCTVKPTTSAQRRCCVWPLLFILYWFHWKKKVVWVCHHEAKQTPKIDLYIAAWTELLIRIFTQRGWYKLPLYTATTLIHLHNAQDGDGSRNKPQCWDLDLMPKRKKLKLKSPY